MSSVARLITRSFGDLPLDRRSCELLGPTALVVQALMGLLAVLSLVYKRHRETQKRPWKIWLYDVWKQVVGAMFIHGLNVLISNFGSYHSSGNACTYYFLNILIDTTLGVGLIYIVLQCATWVLSKKAGIKGLKTGQYGNPPSFTYWIRQASVYIFALTVMKIAVVALFALWPGISAIGDWLLSWTTLWDGDSVQVVFVMGVFPVIMNIVQFWLIDSIVKASTIPTVVRAVSAGDPDSQDHEPLFRSSEDDDDALSRDVEDGPPSSVARALSEGDIKTSVGTENNQKPSGSSSPLSLDAAVDARDHPPNDTSLSFQNSTRPRHKYRRASSSLHAYPITYSAPAVNTFDPSRYAGLVSQSLEDVQGIADVADFDRWEKGDRKSQTGEGWSSRLRSERNRISFVVGAR